MLSQPKLTAQYDALFRRESLTLKQIINIARGAPIKDWPPPEPFLGLFNDLKDSVGRNETPAARHPLFERFDTVRLPDLRKFLRARDRDKRWDPIRDVCERWAVDQEITKGAPSRKLGRPSLAREIEAAYQDLKDTGKIDFSKPRTAVYKEIRAIVRGASGVVKGLGGETIRQVIGPLFDSDKEAKARSNKL